MYVKEMACETEIQCVTLIGSVVNLLLVCLKSICIGGGPAPGVAGVALNQLIYSRLFESGRPILVTLLLLFRY